MCVVPSPVCPHSLPPCVQPERAVWRHMGCHLDAGVSSGFFSNFARVCVSNVLAFITPVPFLWVLHSGKCCVHGTGLKPRLGCYRLHASQGDHLWCGVDDLWPAYWP